MEEVVIGPVFTKQTKEIVEGYIKKFKTLTNQYKQLECRIIKVYFTLNVLEKTYSVPIGHIEDAIKIGRRLQKKGYNDLTLCFNDQKIKIT